jgi:hypothetical protein
MSNCVEEDLAEKDYKNADEFIADLCNFRKSIIRKDKRSSLQILRKIRYGK